jgi:hypothetical protein
MAHSVRRTSPHLDTTTDPTSPGLEERTTAPRELGRSPRPDARGAMTGPLPTRPHVYPYESTVSRGYMGKPKRADWHWCEHHMGAGTWLRDTRRVTDRDPQLQTAGARKNLILTIQNLQARTWRGCAAASSSTAPGPAYRPRGAAGHERCAGRRQAGVARGRADVRSLPHRSAPWDGLPRVEPVHPPA